MYTELTEDTLKQIVSENDKVMVQYGASWCGNCRIMKPKFKKLAAEHPEHAGFPLSQRVDEQTNMTIKTNTSSSYAGAVEEVTDGEERCQDTLESLVLGQLLHTQLQVKERFCNLLFPQTERWREDRRV